MPFVTPCFHHVHGSRVDNMQIMMSRVSLGRCWCPTPSPQLPPMFTTPHPFTTRPRSLDACTYQPDVISWRGTILLVCGMISSFASLRYAKALRFEYKFVRPHIWTVLTYKASCPMALCSIRITCGILLQNPGYSCLNIVVQSFLYI